MIGNPICMARLNADKVKVHEGAATVREATPGGEGEVTLTFAGKAACFSGDAQPPIKWSSQLKCADGAVLRTNGPKTHLHLVELKSKLTVKELLKCSEQFHGGYINGLALCGVLELEKPDATVCLIGFKTETVTPSIAANPSLAKIIPGNPASIVLGNWALGRIDIPGAGTCNLTTVQLDAASNAAVVAI